MEYTTLNNGVKMPMAGIGTFLLSPDEAESSVLHALQDGYRLIDTANAYLNEKAVGRAMKLSGVPRREIFLETKLWPSFYEQPDAVDKTLARLGKKYGKSAAQIILRWHVQCGTIVIPGSKNPEHIRSNFALFNFALTESEMAEIAALDKNQLYYIRTPELLKKYAEMIPPVDEQNETAHRVCSGDSFAVGEHGVRLIHRIGYGGGFHSRAKAGSGNVFRFFRERGRKRIETPDAGAVRPDCRADPLRRRRRYPLQLLPAGKL